MRREVSRLYKAVQNYVEKSGGSVVVIGGVQIQHWPDDGKFSYVVAIKCTGKRPEFAQDK